MLNAEIYGKPATKQPTLPLDLHAIDQTSDSIHKKNIQTQY